MTRIEEIQRQIQESEEFNSPIPPYGINHDNAMALSRHIDAQAAQIEKLRDTIQWAYDLIAKNDIDGAFEKLGFALAATAGGEGAKEPEQEINKPDMLRRLMDEWRTSTGKKQDELMETMLELCFPDETIGGIALTLVAPTPHPEVVVTERDRELAKSLLGPCDYHPMYNRDQCEASYDNAVGVYVEKITDHLATERAEAEAAKRHAKIVVQEVAYERDQLRTQLAATEAKLKEAEGRVFALKAQCCCWAHQIGGVVQAMHDISEQPQPTNAEVE